MSYLMFYKEEELKYRLILEGDVHALSFKMITSKSKLTWNVFEIGFIHLYALDTCCF